MSPASALPWEPRPDQFAAVAESMRRWISGKQSRPPVSAELHCGSAVTAHLRRHAMPDHWHEQHEPATIGGWLLGNPMGPMTGWQGIPVIEVPGLAEDEWKLTVEDITWPDPQRHTAREGTLAPGKPTALEREYWLLDLHLVMQVSDGMRGGWGWSIAGSGATAVRQRLVRHAVAWGHEASEADVKVSWKEPPEWAERGFRTECDMWTAWAEVAVPREPASYPSCGNWFCVELSHWAKADPVDEPAVFAGAVAEHRFLNRLGAYDWWWVLVHRDLYEQVIASRRRQAGGKPLWTIDVRPQPLNVRGD
jgi:hypothetical protein